MAASSNVTAVGGTQFTPNYDGSGNDIGNVPESTWNDSPSPGGASGGGKSLIFAKPAYQQNVTPNDGARDVPDIAFGASGYLPGFYVYQDKNGQPDLQVYGGTSIASPMWAGVTALLSQKGRTWVDVFWPSPRFGSLNPEIYKLGAQSNSDLTGLRDVVTGNNSFHNVTGFSATAGYDQTTGWGTVDIMTFVNAYINDVGPCHPISTCASRRLASAYFPRVLRNAAWQER